MLIILLFMYVFAFKILDSFILLNSTIFVGIILLIYLFFSLEYRRIACDILSKKRVILIFVSLIGVSLYGLFVSTVHQTYEYSFVVTFISQLINLGIGLLVFSLYIKKSKEN